MFKLSDGTSNKMHTGRLASAQEIRNQEIRGFTHIVYDGESHFLYIEEEVERERLKSDLSLTDSDWFKEETGNKNWVLYNKTQFKKDRNLRGRKILRFNAEKYVGGRLEMPANASSCCGMFSWLTIPENLEFGRLFDTRNIVDMSLMFAGCVFPKSFTLGAYFITSKVEDMRYMFYESTLPDGFVLNDRFHTENVKDMEYMFSRCKLPNGFALPEEFDTRKVMDLNHMFYESRLPKDFDFGSAFEFSPNANKEDMFLGCSIGDEVLDIYDTSYIKNKIIEQ